jgi:hypothetical protein
MPGSRVCTRASACCRASLQAWTRFYLHDSTAAEAQLIAAAGLLVGGTLLVGNDSVNVDHAAGSTGAAVGFAMASIGQDLWFYSIFDAYRSARVL